MRQQSSGSNVLSQGKLPGNSRRRMTEQQSIPIMKKEQRVGVSQNVGRKSSFADIEEESEFSRHDEYASGTSTKKASGNRRKKVEIVADERSNAMSKSYSSKVGSVGLANKLKNVGVLAMNKATSIKVGITGGETGKRADKFKR